MLTTTDASTAATAPAHARAHAAAATALKPQLESAAAEPVLPYRCFAVRVKRISQLTPHFIRVTFHSDDLHEFGTDCLDQRIKVVLPLAETGLETFPRSGDWWGGWRALPPEQQNPFRTYTVRAVRPDEREVDVLFVSHGDTGPASSWVSRAVVGDEAILVGPNALSPDSRGGIAWNPGDSRRLLLAGDETAAPAICAIIESLPSDAVGSAFIEIPEVADVLPVTAPAGVTVTWLPRTETSSQIGAGFGERLVREVSAWVDSFCDDCEPTDAASISAGVTTATATAAATAAATANGDDAETDSGVLWDVPSSEDVTAAHNRAADLDNAAPRRDDLYAWLAGEAGAIKTLRRHIVSTNGLDRRQVAFMGYWRIGRSEF